MQRHWISIAVAATLAACVTAKPLTLADAPSGQQVDLQRNQDVTVSLEANPSTGYRWDVILAAPTVLDRAGDEQFVAATTTGGAVGAAGKSVWHFRAARTGTDLLRFAYRRPGDKNVPAARTVVYTMNVR